MTKIIHCADLHLDSPMETHMTEEQASIRNTEIIHTFLRLTEYAAKNDVRAVIIAGDMFDGERIKIRTVDEILDAIGKVMVDNNLHLHIDEKGAAREVGSFSAGMIDCIVLCMRLALVDALFGEEKPFLILDDPFVNLDDKHTKRAREMLDKIAQDHQVIYLVCNSSRQ